MADRFNQFNSLADLAAAKSSLPYPSVSRIQDENDLYIFYRHDMSSKPDTLLTVGNSRFIVGRSPIGGAALLGAAKHSSQTTVPSIL